MEISSDQVSLQSFTCTNYCSQIYYHYIYSLASGTVKDILVCLVNFLAYFEAEETIQESIENEILQTKQQMMQNEKRLNEEQKHLDKCKMASALKPTSSFLQSFNSHLHLL